MPRLNSASLESLNNTPLGPGAMFASMPVVTPEAITEAMGGDMTAGRLLGAMTAAPTFGVANEVQDLTENLVGLNAPLKGSKQLQRADSTFEVELAELTVENLKLIHPMLDEADWMNEATTPVKVGTKLTPRGYMSDSDYTDNLVMVVENKDTAVFMAIRAFNCVSTDDVELSFDDEGNVAGISATFTAHCGEESFDAERGIFVPPYELYRLTNPVVVP